MFEPGDKVKFIRTGAVLTVRVSMKNPRWTGGGWCSFKEKVPIKVGWGNLILIESSSLENV